MGLDIYAYKIKPAPHQSIINNEDVFYLDEENLLAVPEWVKEKFLVNKKTQVFDWEKSFHEYNRLHGTSWKSEDFVFTGATYNRKECYYEFKKDDAILIKLPEKILKKKQ